MGCCEASQQVIDVVRDFVGIAGEVGVGAGIETVSGISVAEVLLCVGSDNFVVSDCDIEVVLTGFGTVLVRFGGSVFVSFVEIVVGGISVVVVDSIFVLAVAVDVVITFAGSIAVVVSVSEADVVISMVDAALIVAADEVSPLCSVESFSRIQSEPSSSSKTSSPQLYLPLKGQTHSPSCPQHCGSPT